MGIEGIDELKPGGKVPEGFKKEYSKVARKSIVEINGIRYTAIAFVCPACIEMVGGSGLHMLAVNSTVKQPSWNWDGNLEKPSLSPSILTHSEKGGVCHSYLRAGVFKYLDDCTHSMKGKQVPLPDLPSWFVEETND